MKCALPFAEQAITQGCAAHPQYIYARCVACYQIILFLIMGCDTGLYVAEELLRSCKSYRMVE